MQAIKVCSIAETMVHFAKTRCKI